jgi:hypothetical protein
LGYGEILFAGSSADADAPDDFAIFLQGNPCEDHDLVVVGGVDAAI